MGRTFKAAPADPFPLDEREFARRMTAIAESGHPFAHADADRLMTQQLRGLGFAAGCTAYDTMPRTYHEAAR